MLLNSSHIKQIIDWINTNPEAAMLYFEIIAVLFGCVGTVTGWLLHGLRFKHNKRLEAQVEIYPAILRASNMLKDALMRNDRLYIPVEYDSNSDKGNIYTLYYNKSLRNVYCKAYHEIDNQELQEYKSLALNLSNELRNRGNYVHPKIFEKKKWNTCLKVLNEFCDFLEGIGDTYVGMYGKQDQITKKTPIHIKSCQKLITAFDYINKTL